MTERVELTLETVKRIHVAAAIATQVRRGSHRNVKVYDHKSGEVLREISLDEALVGIAKVHDLTFSTREDAPQTVCAGWEGKCPKAACPPKSAFEPNQVTRRRGEPWRCRSCVARLHWSTKEMTPEERELRRRNARKAQAALTSAQRSEIRRKMWAKKSQAERSDIALRTWQSRSDEQRHKIASKSAATRRSKAQ